MPQVGKVARHRPWESSDVKALYCCMGLESTGISRVLSWIAAYGNKAPEWLYTRQE